MTAGIHSTFVVAMSGISLSPDITIVLLLASIGIGAFAYRSSERFRQTTGVTPWRIPSLIWALIFLASWLIGLILFTAARRMTMRRLGIPEGAISRKQAGPIYQSSALPIAGWYADPAGEHALRFWNGTEWTEQVREDSVTSAPAPENRPE